MTNRVDSRAAASIVLFIMRTFQKLALATLLSLIVLIFVGAIVRATGAGLGCPDWPMCWGRLVPPMSVDQVDFEELNMERFRRDAERHGLDPDKITADTLRGEFNPVHVWTEYINRLTSMPVGFLSLVLLIYGNRERRAGRKNVFLATVASFILVLANAALGAMVVMSRLNSGLITLHMALAVSLVCVLVYAAWRGCERPWGLKFRDPSKLRGAWIAISVLFFVTIVEGLMGSQVREMTDALARAHTNEPRSMWTEELESTWIYLIHRSFSWLVLGAALAFFVYARRNLVSGAQWLEKGILGIVLAQMVLGLILAQVGVLRVVQVLHIGLSSLLVSGMFLWVLGCVGTNRGAEV